MSQHYNRETRANGSKGDGRTKEEVKIDKSTLIEVPSFELMGRTLSLPEQLDATNIAEFYARNQAHLSEFSAAVKAELLTPEYWEERIRQMHAAFQDDKACNLFIKEDDGRVVGFVNFFNPVRGAFQCCTLGYGLDQERVGQGLVTEGVKLGVKYMFDERNFHRIEANYQPRNLRSENVLKRLGFTLEGVVDNYLYVGNTWVPHMRASTTNRNWKPESA